MKSRGQFYASLREKTTVQTIWKFLRLSRGGRWKDVEKESKNPVT